MLDYLPMFGGQDEILTKKENKSQIMYICTCTVDQQTDPEEIIRKNWKSGLNWKKEKEKEKKPSLKAS